jgi:hypothetical protein
MVIRVNSRRYFYGFPEKDIDGFISQRYSKKDDLLSLPGSFFSKEPYSRSFGSEVSTGVDKNIIIAKKTNELKGGVLIQCLKAHYCAFFFRRRAFF